MSDDSEVTIGIDDEDEAAHPLLDWRMVEGRGSESWVSWLSPEMHWVLGEHRIAGECVLPGTGYLELARAAFEQYSRRTLGEGYALELRDVVFLAPMGVPADGEREVRTFLEKVGDVTQFRISSRADAKSKVWQDHASGTAVWVPMESVPKRDVSELEAECTDPERPIAKGELIPENEIAHFGPRWTKTWGSIDKVQYGPGRQLIRMSMDEEFAGDFERFHLHPALLDVSVFVYPRNASGDDPVHLPFCYGVVSIRAPLPRTVYSYVEDAGSDDSSARFDITLVGEDGTEAVSITNYEQRKIDDAKVAEQVAAGGSSPGDGLRLQIGTPGMLESLKYHPAPRRDPGPGEVEIEVHASGLNFKDVLFALGVLPTPPGEQPKLGMESAGTIVSVGEGVDEFAPGDEVFAMGLRSFASHVTQPASAVAKRPAHMSMAEAATLPNAYYTAYYALVTLGQMRAGQKVLIHTAAGGVGLAATRIAQWVGAEIFATAGSPEKRQYLSDMGVPHVMDSRSLDWAEQVQEITKGGGVDLVLNSLAGDYIHRGLEALAPYGRFLELGLRDILADTKIGMRVFEKSAAFFAVMVSEDIPGFGDIWKEMVALFHDKSLEALPTKVFPVAEIDKAFEWMARAKHIGKVAVDVAGSELPLA